MREYYGDDYADRSGAYRHAAGLHRARRTYGEYNQSHDRRDQNRFNDGFRFHIFLFCFFKFSISRKLYIVPSVIDDTIYRFSDLCDIKMILK